MEYEYEIVKRNDGMYAVCEIRYMDHSINTKQIYVDAMKKNCIERLKQIMKEGK